MTTTSAAATPAPAAASPLSLEVRPDGVAVVTYDVPGEAVNTLKPTFAGDLEADRGPDREQPAHQGGDPGVRQGRHAASRAPTSTC